jgi:hypothetical protein
VDFHTVSAGARLAGRRSVPSFEHEILVALFRARPELACELLRLCVGVELVGAAELGPTDLSQVTPTEYRAEVVVVLRAAARATAAVIVEVQRGVDAGKRWSWPVYVTTLRAQLQAPVTLLVIAPDPAVARWAAQPIEIGHAGFTLVPTVLGFDAIPSVTDEDLARRIPELAVLSAIAHADLDVLRAAVAAIDQLPEDQRELYFDVIALAQPHMLEEMVMQGRKYEFKSDFARHYIGIGREQGREEGQRAAALALARDKLGMVSPEDERRIQGLTGDALAALIRDLGRAADARAARAVMEGIA